MFNDDVAHDLVRAAQANDIEPAALLAIVEVETGGKTFEGDGRTPQFLYERHVAWREAAKISDAVLAAFRKAGLAIPKWNKATQYADERTSALRLQLIGRARALNEECANRSASWGLGQTMGNLAQDLGFTNAIEMVEHQTASVSGQIDCLIRELKHTSLVKSLNAHDFVRVARVYNGPLYAQNQYDVKLRDAHTRWSRKLPQLFVADSATVGAEVPLPKPRLAPPEQLLAADEIEAIQQKLRDLGFAEVGDPSIGRWGTKTTGAIAAFQAHQGLPVTGHYDDATKAALEAAEVPRPVEPERANATVQDLREAGSDTIAHADGLSTLATGKKTLGGLLLGGAAAEHGDLLGNASETLDKVDQAKTMLDRLHGFLADPVLIVLAVVVIAAGFTVAIYAERIRQNRLNDHQTGEHAGPSGA